MKCKVFLMPISLLWISCHSQKQEDESGIAMNQKFVEQFNDEIRKDSLINRITIHGDTNAYKELYSTYAFSGHEKEWCYYAFVMANNFNYPEAYTDLYIVFRADSASSNLKTNKLANYYLLKAYENGVKHTDSEIKERFGQDSLIPNSVEYLSEIEQVLGSVPDMLITAETHCGIGAELMLFWKRYETR